MKRQRTRLGQRRHKEMYGHIESWQQSGQSQYDYYMRHGISKSVFGYWLRKYRAASSVQDSGFIGVSAPELEAPSAGVFVRLQSGDGRELVFHEAVSAAYLRELLGW